MTSAQYLSKARECEVLAAASLMDATREAFRVLVGEWRSLADRETYHELRRMAAQRRAH